jgi:hypothetical protein
MLIYLTQEISDSISDALDLRRIIHETIILDIESDDNISSWNAGLAGHLSQKKPEGFAKGEKNSMYGKKRPDRSEMNRTRLHPFLGKKRPEHSKKMSENNPMAKIGKELLFWNNGTTTIRSKECPGEGWTRGMVKRVKS